LIIRLKNFQKEMNMPKSKSIFNLRCKEIIFSGHAIQRMFERGISRSSIRMCIQKGEIIEEYPNDIPYPSALVLGFVSKRPLHIVLAIDKKKELCTIVTVYEPNNQLWENGFKKRRSR
jgi:hypothetical protein